MTKGRRQRGTARQRSDAAWQPRGSDALHGSRVSIPSKTRLTEQDEQPVGQDESRRADDAYCSTVDYQARMLEVAGELREAMRAAEHARDAQEFAAAVAAELNAGRVYIERLQARVSKQPEAAGHGAEETVRELRRRRIALAARLAEFEAASEDKWPDAGEPVRAASAELERAFDEAAAKFD